jgi:Family of unknown function (DUF6480)
MARNHTEHDVPHVPDEGLAVPGQAGQRAGETPPAESGVSDLGAPERKALSRGWGPLPLVVIMVFVALVVIGMVAQVVSLLT